MFSSLRGAQVKLQHFFNAETMNKSTYFVSYFATVTKVTKCQKVCFDSLIVSINTTG
jgi:hypothetical protein